jgi:pilus assembly protein CpaE
MSAFTPNETSRVWQAQRPEAAVQLYLTAAEGDPAELIGGRVAGFPLQLTLVPLAEWIDVNEVSSAAAAVVEVNPDSPASIKRFQKLASECDAPLIAAAYDPPLSLVRSLLRLGAHDVLPLPLDFAELEASLLPLRDTTAREHTLPQASEAKKLVSVVKSSGGVGATALLTQLAVRFAEREAKQSRGACLIDLDLQFGDAAFQLGLRPTLSFRDAIDAGSRLDPTLLRSIASQHPSGLQVIAAPPEMLPLEAVTSDQVIDVVVMAQREFGTVFLDLPTNWTNWSLSLLARSDLALLVTELSVPGLRRARRQLDLLQAQDLDLDVRVVVNRHEKALFRRFSPADVRQALGRDIAYTVANDWSVMSAAINRGVTLDDVKRRSAVGKDISTLDAAIANALRLER